MAKGQLIVISGPSGVGKSTLIRSLTAKLQRQPFFSVSATTRKMRPGEIDHVNYHFITQAEFDRMVAQNEFLEHATYAAQLLYGTPAAPILAQLEAGRDVLLDIEVQGALQVKRSDPDAAPICIAAPSFGELEVPRPRARGDTAEERCPPALADCPPGVSAGTFLRLYRRQRRYRPAVSKSFWRS